MANEPVGAPHTGLVIAVDGDEATLRFTRGKMCARCGACLSAGPQQMELKLPNTLGASVGELVAVELAGGRVAGASLIAYLIPLALFLLGVWLGSRVSDLWALVCGVGGCMISFMVLRLIDKRIKRSNRFQPRMREIIRADSMEEAAEEIEK